MDVGLLLMIETAVPLVKERHNLLVTLKTRKWITDKEVLEFDVLDKWLDNYENNVKLLINKVIKNE